MISVFSIDNVYLYIYLFHYVKYCCLVKKCKLKFTMCGTLYYKWTITKCFLKPEHVERCTWRVLVITKCSEWAIVTVFCPSSVRACVRERFYLNDFTSKTTHWIWPHFTGMIPRCSQISCSVVQVVQTVPVGCISR